MTSKRREFIDRLLRISELNEELLQFSDKNRQPAFTKRIKLVQMGKAQFNMPFQPPQSQLPRHNCKILVIDKHTNRYHSQQHNRSKTSEFPKSQSETPQSSPSKQESSSVKINFSNRRSSQAISNGQAESCSIVTPMHCELKNQIVRCSDLIKRPKSQYKNSRQVISSAKNIYHYGQGQSLGLLSPKISAGGIVNGRSIKFHKANTMGNDYQRRTQEEKKAKYQRIKEISRNYSGPFVPPPKISAKSYIICEAQGDSIKPIACFNSKNSQEVASLTKIMTCILILQLCERAEVNMDEEEVKIGRYQSSIGGTSAELQQGQIYTVRQLLYGLMLPSGNDASLALAVWGGRRLLEYTACGGSSVKPGTALLEIQMKKLTKSSCYSRFIREMNEKALILGMNKTKYANSHGLANPNNRSTAYDIAVLSHYAMQNSTFREIVSCKTYEATIKCQSTTSKHQLSCYKQQSYKQFDEQDEVEDEEIDRQPTIQCPESPIKYSSKVSSSQRMIAVSSINKMLVRWENTHKLLHSRPGEYVGIKTGVTNAAGPCLSSMVKVDNRQFIIIVLACSKIALRFKETQLLKRWLFKHEGISAKAKKINSLKYERKTEEGGSDSQEQWGKQDD